MAVKFKGCPKCHGDLYLNRDLYGRYVTCLQCGYMKDLVEGQQMAMRGPVVEVEERQAA